MWWAMLLGVALLLASSATAAARVVSDVNRGEAPTASLLIEPKDPTPPRIEVRAQPPERVKINVDMNCTHGARSRRRNRTIRTNPPFSGRVALTLSNPDRCSIFVLARYDDESEDAEGHSQRGTMTLRIYR